MMIPYWRKMVSTIAIEKKNIREREMKRRRKRKKKEEGWLARSLISILYITSIKVGSPLLISIYIYI